MGIVLLILLIAVLAFLLVLALLYKLNVKIGRLNGRMEVLERHLAANLGDATDAPDRCGEAQHRQEGSAPAQAAHLSTQATGPESAGKPEQLEHMAQILPVAPKRLDSLGSAKDADAALEPTMGATTAQNEVTPPSYANRVASKVFSWIGGFLLFLGAVFAIKYSIENDLISPLLRVAGASAGGLGLIATSYLIRAEKYKATSDTLCAAGLAILYGSIFSSRYYNFLSITAAFLMMGGVSMASFWLASNRKAQYIGFLGAASGFLVPLLLSAGPQNHLMLFAYLAIISAGAIGAGVKEGWDKLIAASLCLAFLFQFVWFAPKYNPRIIIDFCIVTSVYTSISAFIAWFFRKRLSIFSRRCFAFYIAMSFLLIFLTDFSLIVIGLAFFVNLVLAALFYSDAIAYNIPFRIVNIAAFLLLALWASVSSDKGENALILLLASLAFTALNVLVSMAKKSNGDSFSAALPLGALLLLFCLPPMDFWPICAFALVVASGSIMTAFRSNSPKIALFATAIFALFMIVLLFSHNSTHGGYGALGAAIGGLWAVGLLCALAFGNFLPEGAGKLGITACLMPFLFISLFMLKGGAGWSWDLRMLLGLIFCAATAAIILLISQYKRNGQHPMPTVIGPTALGASVPLLIASPSLGTLGQGSALCLLIWALFFLFPFVSGHPRRESKGTLWAASVIAGAALLVGALLNMRYANLACASAAVAGGYGATAAWARRSAGKPAERAGAPPLVVPLAWLSLFLFVNVQVAHFFSPQEIVAFAANGSLPKTVAYTLVWGIYGMATIFLGARAKGKWGAIGGIGLVSIALLKLFLSDVWLLNTLHRVVVFMGMAAVLIAGSFAYQALQKASAAKRGGPPN